MTAPIAGVIQGDLPGQVALREWALARKAYWESPPRGICSKCHAGDEILDAEGGSCAECQRKVADRRRDGVGYPCDLCGGDAAFRDPMHRRDEYLCTDCHEREGYVPGDRAMVTKIASRQGVTHSMGRTAVCVAAGRGSDCKGEIKQRGKLGELCTFHFDPKRYLKNKG